MIIQFPARPHARSADLSRPIALLLILTLIGLTVPPLPARNRKGDKFLAQGKAAEAREDWDKALQFDEQALSEDPSDAGYQLDMRRMRFQTAAYHVKNGQKIRTKGQLAQALAEFERAYAIDPSSDIAEQEVHRTKVMIDREKRKPAARPEGQTDQEAAEERGMTPAQVAKKDADARFESLLPLPELRPLTAAPINLKMNNQKPRVLFETVGKLAGINVLFDPEYEAQNQTKPQSIDFNGSTLEQSLDYLAVVTKSYWKALSSNTIFVTLDNPTKLREYQEQVVKTFYLSNVTTPQELQEIITTLRTVVEITKIFNYTSQNALVVRAEADRMALAEKIIADLDKPRSEVVIDVMVMEVNSVHTRNLAAAFAPQGINSNILFTPRQSIQTLASSLGTGTTSGTGTGTNIGNTGIGSGTGIGTGNGTGTGTGNTTTSSAPIPLVNLRHISTKDYSISNVPGGLLEALLNDRGTRVLQSPSLRAVDNMKAVLKIGDKVPTASGSFQPGIGGVGINPLVNTQFTFLDTGVNLEITPKVHDNGEVSLHVDINISQVKDRIDLGGISQPIIGSRTATLDVRLKDGQANLLGGLIQNQDTKTVSGIPGLANIPILRRLFTSELAEKDMTELLIVLIPHIVRGPDLSDLNMKGIAAGNQTTVKLSYAPRKAAAAPEPGTTAELPGATMVPGAPISGPPATAPAVTPPAPGITPPIAGPPATAPPQDKTPTTPSGNVRVSFAPAQIDTQVNFASTVNVQVDNATDLQSVEAQLKYDPKVLRINSISAGDVLQRTGPPLAPSLNILNDSGDASFSMARASDQGGVTGGGGLITIVFQAIGKGTSTISFQSLTLKSSGGQAIATSMPALVVNVK